MAGFRAYRTVLKAGGRRLRPLDIPIPQGAPPAPRLDDAIHVAAIIVTLGTAMCGGFLKRCGDVPLVQARRRCRPQSKVMPSLARRCVASGTVPDLAYV